MPRSRGVPGYRLHRPSGQARVIIDGRHIYLGPFGSPESREKYQAIIREHQAERARRELERSVGPVADITVNEALVRYTQHFESYYRKHDRPTSQVLLIRLAIKVLRENFGDLEARRFGPKALKQCQDAFVGQELSREECNRRVRLVRQFFKWAVGEELIPPSVLEALKAVPALQKGRTSAPERPPIRAVPDVYVDAALPHMPRVVAAMVLVQRWTGCRPAEVVQMRGRDLTMTGDVWEYRPAHHKLDHHDDIDRVVMVGPKAQEVIRPWLKPDLGANLFDPDDWQQEQREEYARRRSERGGRLYPSQVRRLAEKRKTTGPRSSRHCYSVAGYRRAIHRACDAAGVPRFSPNRIRHLTATVLRREIGIEASRVVLGHGDADTTTIYAEKDLELAREAMRRFG